MNQDSESANRTNGGYRLVRGDEIPSQACVSTPEHCREGLPDAPAPAVHLRNLQDSGISCILTLNSSYRSDQAVWTDRPWYPMQLAP